MKNILKAVLILAAFTAVSCASSGPIKVTKLADLPTEINLKNLPTQQQFPHSDGVILYENIIYDVDYVPSVGIETYKTYHKVYRVFRDIENFMEQHIILDDDTVFKSFTARTIKPDGTTIDITIDDIYYWKTNKKNKDHKSSFEVAAYNIPNLKEGDLFEIKYVEINSFFYLSDRYYAQSRLPKKYSRFEINIPNFIFDPPSPFYFEYVSRNIDIDKPEYSKGFGDSGDRKYVWTKKDIPAYIPEPEMGLENNYIGHVDLRLSRWNSWKYYGSKHYERYYEDILDDMSGEEETLISEKKNELVKNADNDLEKIKALYDYVQTYPYSMTHVFFGHARKPNNIETIFKRGYGDCKDHAVLLTALLRSAGFTAWPALINADEKEIIDPDFVTGIFNHVIVKTYLEGGQVIWLDPTATYTPFGKLPEMDEGNHTIEIRPRDKVKDKKITLMKAPQTSYSDHLTKVKIKSVIKPEKLTYGITVNFFGNIAEMRRYQFSVSSRKDILQELRKSMLPDFFDADISDITIENLKDYEKPLTLRFNVSIKTEKFEKFPFFPLKLNGNPIDPNKTFTGERNYPLILESIYRNEVKVAAVYDKDVFEFDHEPEKISGEVKFKDAAVWKTKASKKPGEINFSFTYEQKKKKINAQDVNSYLETIIKARKQVSKAYGAVLTEKKKEQKKQEEKKPENNESDTTEKDKELNGTSPEESTEPETGPEVKPEENERKEEQ